MIYIILGETCSGKSSLALKVCKNLNLPLISSDAFGVYEGFDIGSAKSTPVELEGIENYFISSIPFGKPMTVYDYQSEGRKIIEDLNKRNKDIVIVGGTFLYVKGLLFPYVFPSEGKNENLYDEKPLEEMIDQLKILDPKSLETIDIKNPRRVARALDLAKSGNKRQDIVDKYSNKPLYPCVFIRIRVDKDELREKIRKRVEKQVEDGLFEEEDRLERLDPDFSSTFRGIGFKEIYDGRKKNLSREEIIENIIVDTTQYARRQRTFLRHQFPYMVELDKENVCEFIEEDIKLRNELESLDFPLIISSSDLMDKLSSIYATGIRQCCIKGEYDIEKVSKSFPLLQIAPYDEKRMESRKIPPFSYTL